MLLASCGACSRYVKAHEAACPFCGAARVGRAEPDARAFRRASRSAWLARGSALALVGCTSATPSGPGAVAGGAPSVFDCPEGGASDAMVGHGKFFCAEAGTLTDVVVEGGETVVAADAAILCDRATEYCYRQGATFECEPLAPQLCPPFGICSGLVSCACGIGAANSGSCVDDDAGGVTLSAPCYGAPPARLERLFAAGQPVA